MTTVLFLPNKAATVRLRENQRNLTITALFIGNFAPLPPKGSGGTPTILLPNGEKNVIPD